MKYISPLGVLCVALLTSTQVLGKSASFSVIDSLRMQRFNTQSIEGQPTATLVNDSPNHAFGLVLTSRGLIESNEIQSTISLIDYRQMQTTLAGERSISASPPQPLATITAIPQFDARGTGAYGSVVFNIQWSADSRTVFFLGETLNGRRQLYSVSVATRIVRSLTPKDLDVQSFVVVRDTIVYRASSISEDNDQRLPGLPTGPSTSVVTGLPIADIMGNEGTQRLRQYSLWRYSHGKNDLVLKVRPAVQASSFLLARPLSLSPNSRFAILLLQPETIPSSWEKFETPRQFSTLKLDQRDPWPTSPYNGVNPLREYVLVDLDRHTEAKLGAVDARYFAFPGTASIRWSGNSEKILITNVLLASRESMKGAAGSIGPCAVAVFNLQGHTSSCVALGKGNTSETDTTHLQSGSLNTLGNVVTLRYGVPGQPQIREIVYRSTEAGWSEIRRADLDKDQSPESPTPSITLATREGLNDRPTLWAKDEKSGREAMIWDPNPDLKNIEIGRATLYQWKDRSGRLWSGGLFYPIGYVKGHRYPLVIQTHGFTPTKFVVDGAYPTAMAARALASEGIMVLQVGDGGDPSHIGTMAEASDNVAAYSAAIQSLDAAGEIDSRKVGIVGFSRTCWYVERALIEMPHMFAAAIMADGVSYSYMQYHLFGSGDSYTQADDEQVVGSAPFGSGLQKWIMNATDFHADQIITPLRIEAIRPISILNEWELYSSLSMQKKAVDLIYYRTGQHVLQKPLERLVSEQGAVDWFKFWLQGREDPDVAKHSQYLRWRRMRDSETYENFTRR